MEPHEKYYDYCHNWVKTHNTYFPDSYLNFQTVLCGTISVHLIRVIKLTSIGQADFFST